MDLTREEQQFLESYYNLFRNEPDILDSLSIEEKKKLKNVMKEVIWNNISKNKQEDKKVRSLNNQLIRTVAAAAVLIVVSAASMFFLFNMSSKKRPVGVTSVPLALQNHIENRVILLPDGSSVILSPGSKLNYPSSFDGREKREVFLEGQAFFDIKHNASRTFIVHTGKLETIVLGTAFNIRAIPGESNITVTVKRGKVKVTNQDEILGVILPNQQITYYRGKVSSKLDTVDNESYLDWKDQDLLFDNLTIAEAAKLLEERYRVKITISNLSISSQRFTASFSKDEGFEQALKIICVFNEVAYKYNKEESTAIICNK